MWAKLVDYALCIIVLSAFISAIVGGWLLLYWYVPTALPIVGWFK